MGGLLRLGVVGLGGIGRHHARIAASLEGVRLVGAVDPAGDPHGALGERPVLSALEPLLALGVDAVVLATPPAAHLALARRLAAAGVACLIEKPLAPTAAAAARIAAAFAPPGPLGAVGHVERHNPAALALARALAAGAVGPPRALDIERAGPAPARPWSVGVLRDLAIHDLDLMAWLAGPVAALDPLRAAGQAIELTGRLRGGARFRLRVDGGAPSRRRRWRIQGAAGALGADLLAPAAWLEGPPRADLLGLGPHEEPLRRQLRAFCAAAAGRPGPPPTPLAVGVAALALVERAEATLAPQGRATPNFT